jgi:hypothetical protein
MTRIGRMSADFFANYTSRTIVLGYNWNAENADRANFHGFFLIFHEWCTEFQKKSALIRVIRVIRVPIVSQNHPTQSIASKSALIRPIRVICVSIK